MTTYSNHDELVKDVQTILEIEVLHHLQAEGVSKGQALQAIKEAVNNI